MFREEKRIKSKNSISLKLSKKQKPRNDFRQNNQSLLNILEKRARFNSINVENVRLFLKIKKKQIYRFRPTIANQSPGKTQKETIPQKLTPVSKCQFRASNNKTTKHQIWIITIKRHFQTMAIKR